MDPVEILTILVGGGLFAFILAVLKDMRASRFDGVTIMSNSTSMLIKEHQQRINTLHKRVTSNEERIAQLQGDIDKLGDTWRIWYADLYAKWAIYREKDKPPKAPLA